MTQQALNQQVAQFTRTDGTQGEVTVVTFGTKPLTPMTHSQKKKISKRFKALKASTAREVAS